MKWLGLGIALVGANGCCLEIVQTGVDSASSTTASGRGASVGANSGGTAAGASSSGQGGSGNGSSTGGGVNGGGTSCIPPCGPNANCATDANGSSSCQCNSGYESCPSNEGTICADVSNDNANCGYCGLTCPSLQSCLGGSCVCDSVVCVEDGGLFCVDIETDPAFCGSCDNVCSPAGTPCVGGICACPVGEAYCTDSTLAGISTVCADTNNDPLNCGVCNNDCNTSYADNASCTFGLCTCESQLYQLCVEIPSNSPPTCNCSDVAASCASPSFATDVYPLLAQQSGTFGCSASGCHSGIAPAAGLGFLDQFGDMDAGMAYAELVGTDGGNGSNGAPSCDGGGAGAAATQCSCVSRVVAGNIYASYLIDVITDDLPGNCDWTLPMPTDGVNWLPLNSCSQKLLEQWVEQGANP